MIHVDYTYSQLLDTFLNAILSNSTLKDLCFDKFGKYPQYALGNDERREWGLSDAPFIVLIPTSWDGGITTGQVTFSFDIDIGIEDSTFEDYDQESVVSMRGFRTLDEIVNVVMDIILDHARTYNAIGDQTNCVYNNSEFFPLHVATLNVDVQVPTVMNGTRTLGG